MKEGGRSDGSIETYNEITAMLTETEKVLSRLASVGMNVNGVWDLVNTSKPYPAAVPVLLELLQEGIEHIGVKEGVIRALAVKEAVGKASQILLDEYNKIPKEEMSLRWSIGNTIYTTITVDDVERILPIVQDRENGYSRQMFVMALGKLKSGKVEDVLIELLDDDDVVSHALWAAGRMKSKKAKERILTLSTHPNTLIKREALKALKKLSN